MRTWRLQLETIWGGTKLIYFMGSMTQASSLKQNHRYITISPALKQSSWKMLEGPSLDRELDMSKNVLRADQNMRAKVVKKQMGMTRKISSVGHPLSTVLLKAHGTLQCRDKASPTTKIPPQVPSVDSAKIAGSEKKTRERHPPLKNIFINREGHCAKVVCHFYSRLIAWVLHIPSAL